MANPSDAGQKPLKRVLAAIASLLLFIALVYLASLPARATAAGTQGDIFSFLPLVFKAEEPTPTTSPSPPPPGVGEYVVIGWNDLGMHCYNRDFQDLAVLPPYNTLWAQVIRRGEEPQIVTSGVTVTYSFPENTYSAGKSNFWTYAFQLFGVQLQDNIGLTGKGLAGEMDLRGDHYIAEGIPLTEYNDNDLNNRQPYQLANIVVKDSSGKVLASNQVVAPVSTEMRCDLCHYNGAFGISTGRVESNILQLHDQDHQEDYPAGHTGPLMDRRPILCAECHASNALAAPGVAGIPNLSKVMHEAHAGNVPDSIQGCYQCHPGPSTKCLRDVMSQEYGLDCTNCHGGMVAVSQTPNPWLREPRCDNAGCHPDAAYALNQPLYRHSQGHGGIYCEGCHDSTHAIAPSREARDAIKFINLQGHAGTLEKCTVCHLTTPSSGGPHGED